MKKYIAIFDCRLKCRESQSRRVRFLVKALGSAIVRPWRHEPPGSFRFP
jgi:hypothetical protein